MRLYWHQLASEQRLFWRAREAAFFVFIFPVLLFLLLASVYTGTIYGVPAPRALLAGLIGYGAANTAFAGLAITLVIRRESAVLKRLRSTPLPAPVFVAALLTSTLIVFAAQTVALFGLGIAFFHCPFPGRVVSLILAVLVGTIVFAALGVATASLIRSAEGSSAVVNVVLLPMAFITGSFGPTRHYPKFIRAVGDVLPLKYFIKLVNAVYLQNRELWTQPRALAVLAVWGAIGVAVAARRFRWEPREG